MVEDQRSKRSLFGAGARRRSQVQIDEAEAALAQVDLQPEAAPPSPEPAQTGPPPLPSRWSVVRSSVEAQQHEASPERGPPPPIPSRPELAARSPDDDLENEGELERTQSPPGWPSLHELVPPRENDNFVSPRTESCPSAWGPASVPTVHDGWHLQASPRGGSLVLPNTPAAVTTSAAVPRNASSLARSLSGLSTASPAGTPRVDSPHSPQSPKQLAAAEAASEAKVALDRAQAATETAARTMELARQTARLRRERQIAEDEARRSLDAARQTLPLRYSDGYLPPENHSNNLKSAGPPALVPDGVADNEVSMALAAGEAISSLLSYLQSSKELKSTVQEHAVRRPMSPQQSRPQVDMGTFPSPSGLTFTGRRGVESTRAGAVEPEPEAEPEPEPGYSPETSTQIVLADGDSSSGSEGIDPDLWARSVSTALAFRCFTEGVRASLLERRDGSDHLQLESEAVPPVILADAVTSNDEENIAPTENRQHQRVVPPAAERLKAVQSKAFAEGKSAGAAATVRQQTGGLSQEKRLDRQQQNRTATAGQRTIEVDECKTTGKSGSKLVTKREERRTHTQQQRVLERQQGRADLVGGDEHGQEQQEHEQEHLHWSRRGPGTSVTKSRSPIRRQRAAHQVVSPHKGKGDLGIRAVNSTGNADTSTTAPAKRLKNEGGQQHSRTSRAQEATHQANAQLRADRQRRARSTNAQQVRRPNSPRASILARDRSALTPQEIAKAEYRSYRRTNQSSAIDTGSWHAEREAYLEFQRLQLEEQRQAECTGKPNLAGSFAEAVDTAVAAAVQAAVKAEKAEREAARKLSPARQRRKQRNAVQNAARAVARNQSPSPEKAQQVVSRQRKNMAREVRNGQHKQQTGKFAQFDEEGRADSVKVKVDTRSVSRHRQADIEEKLAALEEFRLENLRLEEELAEAKLKETQARLENRPITAGDRQRAWEQGRQERELIKVLEEQEAAAAAQRAQIEARARQREDDRERRRDARERGLSLSRSDWGDSGRSPSPRSTLSPGVDQLHSSHSQHRDTLDEDRSRSSSRNRPVRDLSTVPTMSSRHKKTTVDHTGGSGAHLRDKTNVSDTRTRRDLDLQAKDAAASSPLRPASSRRRRRRSSSPAHDDSSHLTGEHTMSSRHRKTTATPKGRVDTNDLSHGGVTAAELFAKFQSGQHLRDGRPTAAATQSGGRSKTMSPARRRRGSPNAPGSVHQELVSTRLSTPKRSRGDTLFQQSQAEQEAAALVRDAMHNSERIFREAVARAVAAATKQKLLQDQRRRTGSPAQRRRDTAGVPGFAQPRGDGRRSRAATPPPAPSFRPNLGASFHQATEMQREWEPEDMY